MKPKVTIELQPFLQDYLYHEFTKSDDGDGVQITSANDMGKFIQAMITLSDRPPKQELKEHPITLYLPVQELNHHLLRENFIYNFRRPELNYLTAQEGDFAKNFARFVNERNVIKIMDELSDAQQDIEQNVNPRIVFFDFALKMIVLLIQ